MLLICYITVIIIIINWRPSFKNHFTLIYLISVHIDLCQKGGHNEHELFSPHLVKYLHYHFVHINVYK
jgi:hypothetical protein